jgi:transposase
LSLPVDPKTLPEDPATLKRMLVDITSQLDRTERLLRQLLQAKTGSKSEQLSREQLALFAAELGMSLPEAEESDDPDDEPPAGASASGSGKPRGRKPLPRHLKRERIEHDLEDQEKHCAACDQDLRRIGEEVSERYEYLPAQMKVIEDACFTYACVCTVKTASKPPQPIEKSTASASVLAQVIVSKLADHLPLHRQAKMFRRHGIEIAEQTLCGWMAQSAELLQPLYERLKRHVLASKVVGTDDTPVKVLDRNRGQARKGRIWPYVGDREHPAVVYDYTATRERAGPEEFLQNYRGYLQADAYVAYDSFFLKPERGMVEVGCWAHARRHVHQALDNDPSRMRTLLLMIAELYRVEKLARQRALRGEDLRLMREQGARPVLDKLHAYLLQIRAELLPKSEAGSRGELYPEKLDRADALLRKSGSIDRQQSDRAFSARLGRGPQQLDVFRQRPRRENGGGAAQLRRLLRTGEGGPVRLVSGCALAHRIPPHHPARRTAAPPLGFGLREGAGRKGLISWNGRKTGSREAKIG